MVRLAAPSVALQTEQPRLARPCGELTEDFPQLVSGSNRQIDNFIFLVPPALPAMDLCHRINGGVDQQTEIMFNGVPEAFSETAGYTFWNQPPYDSIKKTRTY